MKTFSTALAALAAAMCCACTAGGLDMQTRSAVDAVFMNTARIYGPADGQAAKRKTAAYAPVNGNAASVAAMRELGHEIFFDTSLSASGKMSCASCHHPDHAYGPPNKLSVQLGGKGMQDVGTRAVPSLRYLQKLPPFSEHFFDNDGDDSKDQGPTGGHDWDGRAASAHEQAAGPLLSPLEMANADEREVVEKLRKAPYAAAFRKTFGNDIFERQDDAFRSATMALEVFQQTAAEFYPYTSKYDAVLRGQATLSAQEARGLRLFNDPAKGNCASCHPSGPGADGGFPQFTDYGFIALGVPRNRKLPANADPAYHDMGLCGPQRKDLAHQQQYCGLFRTPSLRNAAVRNSFFHNGVLHTLQEVLEYYAQRDTHPANWYPRDAGNKIRKFDDLPSQYHQNVYSDAPFGQKAGGRPALSKAEIKDIIAFLNTLTDNDRPERQAAEGRKQR